MWTEANRVKYERKGARYPSDATDEEWAIIEPMLPPAKKPRKKKVPVDRREVWNAIQYQLATGCQWRQLPKDFPPRSTVHDYFIEWRCDGTFQRLHYALYVELRSLCGREAEPSLAIVDSQSVKSAEKGGETLIRRVTMAARKSKASSGIWRSTRSAS